jgi:phospholipid transport system substrate-binding protein
MRSLRYLIVICSLAAWSSLSLAADGPGVATVRKANEAVSELIKREAPPGSEEEKRLVAEISARLKGFLDIDELGQRALRDHWSKLTAPQKKQFLELLRQLVDANYIRALRGNRQYEVRYVKEEPEGENIRVYTELTLKKPDKTDTVSVDYVLRKDNGDWRAFDLVTDGVGLVENYRAQFNKIMAKEGFDGLLARMRKKKTDA